MWLTGAQFWPFLHGTAPKPSISQIHKAIFGFNADGSKIMPEAFAPAPSATAGRRLLQDPAQTETVRSPSPLLNIPHFLGFMLCFYLSAGASGDHAIRTPASESIVFLTLSHSVCAAAMGTVPLTSIADTCILRR